MKVGVNVSTLRGLLTLRELVGPLPITTIVVPERRQQRRQTVSRLQTPQLLTTHRINQSLTTNNQALRAYWHASHSSPLRIASILQASFSSAENVFFVETPERPLTSFFTFFVELSMLEALVERR